MIHIDAPADGIPGWPELRVQSACLDMLRLCFPRVTVFAVPNGSRRTVWQAVQAKREGMRAGAADLVLTWCGPMAAFVEVKKQRGRLKVSQREFLEEVAAQGFIAAVVRSPNTLFGILKDAGAPWSGVAWRLVQ